MLRRFFKFAACRRSSIYYAIVVLISVISVFSILRLLVHTAKVRLCSSRDHEMIIYWPQLCSSNIMATIGSAETSSTTRLHQVYAKDPNKFNKGTILIINAAVLTPDVKGGDDRILACISSLLSLGYHIIYIHYGIEDGHLHHSRNLANIGVEIWGPLTESFHMLTVRVSVVRPIAAIEWLWTNGEYFGFLRTLNNLIKINSPDTPIITVSDDIIYQRTEVDFKNDKQVNRLVSSFLYLEKFFWQNADIKLFISEAVRDKASNTVAMSNVGLLRYCHSIEKVDVPFNVGAREGIGFLGYNNQANRQVLQWYFENVQSYIIRQYNTTIPFHIFGNVMPPEHSCILSRGCIYHGSLSNRDLKRKMSSIKLFVAPVFTDAGISTKIIYALSCGTPVITTTGGLSGFPSHARKANPSPLMISNLRSFGDDLFRLYHDSGLMSQMQSLAKEFVKLNFNCSSMTEDISLALTTMGKRLSKKESSQIMAQPAVRIYWDYGNDDSSSTGFKMAQKLLKSLLDDSRSKNIMISSGNRCDDSQYSMVVRFASTSDGMLRPHCCAVNACKFVVYFYGNSRSISSHLSVAVDELWVSSSYVLKLFASKINFPSHKLALVPHGIDCSEHRSNSQNLRTHLRINKDTTLFAFIGEITAATKISTLIDGWASAFRVRDDVALVIYVPSQTTADTKQLNTIKYAARWPFYRQIHLIDASVVDAAAVYEGIDILVNPIKYEAFSVSALTAIALGKTVIALDTGSSADFVSRYYSHVLSPSSPVICDEPHCMGIAVDASKLAKSMRDAWKNRERLKARALFGTDYVCNHFSWGSITDIVMQRFKRHLERESGDTSAVNQINWSTTSEFESAISTFMSLWRMRNITMN